MNECAVGRSFLITLANASYTSSVAIQRQLLLKGEAYRVQQYAKAFPFEGKVACEARRMRCRTRSVRYLTTAFVLITLAVASYTSSPPTEELLLKEKPIEFSNMPKLSPLRGKWRAKHVE